MKSFTSLLVVAIPAFVSAQSTGCTFASLNQTVGSYAVQASDTIQSVAATVNRGVCDIARANSMADPTMITTDNDLIIPAQVCVPDETTCLLPTVNEATSLCIYGGPHTYTTQFNDTLTKIAIKMNIATDTLSANIGRTAATYDEVIAAGGSVKLPQCIPSACTVQPYRFINGTYFDLAAAYNTTVGQIQGFNAGYNYSNSADAEDRPVITLPTNCGTTSDNVTVIS